jgi:zinc transporter 2
MHDHEHSHEHNHECSSHNKSNDSSDGLHSTSPDSLNSTKPSTPSSLISSQNFSFAAVQTLPTEVEEVAKLVQPPKRNLNVEAAYLHILGDVLNSVGVIIASALIYYDERLWFLDPICTLFFACIVFYTTRITFWHCCEILMEVTPDDFEPREVEKALGKIEGVNFVHDLHIWSLSSSKHALIVHLRLKEGAVAREVLSKADAMIRKKFKINHLTIQIEEAAIASAFECGNDLHL